MTRTGAPIQHAVPSVKKLFNSDLIEDVFNSIMVIFSVWSWISNSFCFNIEFDKILLKHDLILNLLPLG